MGNGTRDQSYTPRSGELFVVLAGVVILFGVVAGVIGWGAAAAGWVGCAAVWGITRASTVDARQPTRPRR